jgi:hypothetical protein
MTTDTTYNGWTNKATWLVGVWNFFEYDYVKEHIQEAIDQGKWDDYGVNFPGGITRALTLHLADWMEEEHDEHVEASVEYLKWKTPAINSGYLLDHINNSIGRINWLEIAEHYVSEINEALDQANKE